MGLRIVNGFFADNPDDDCAVLVCGTSGQAFGHYLANVDEAQRFVDWLAEDPRVYRSDLLERSLQEFRALEESCRSRARSQMGLPRDKQCRCNVGDVCQNCRPDLFETGNV